MRRIKSLCSFLLVLVQVFTPLIWSIAYIRMIFDVGFVNIPAFLNFVGITSLLVAYNQARSFIKAMNLAVDTYKNKQHRTP